MKRKAEKGKGTKKSVKKKNVSIKETIDFLHELEITEKKESQESDIDENEYTEEISKINDDDSILVIKKEEPLDIESEEHSNDYKEEESKENNKKDKNKF